MSKRLFASLAVFAIFSAFTVRAGDSVPANQIKTDSLKEVNREDLALGERLFKGLITTGTNTLNCAGCHNTGYIDTLNWNPSAYEIAVLYKNRSAKDLKSVLTDPTGVKMSEVHADVQLDDQQIGLIKDYMDHLASLGKPARKPLVTNLLLFIFSFVLALLITADLIFFHKFKFRLVHVVLLLLLAAWQVSVVTKEAIAIGRSKDYAPLQPIKFSHKVHVEGNRIDCKYCHSTVEDSKNASIPSANVCLNCHNVVREGTRSGKFEINKIHMAVDSNKPIEWIKVHNLPDFVFFSHAQHVAVGKIDCKECHGEVKEMNVVRQVSDLSMGFCIKCHREHEVRFNDNAFYKNWKEFHEKMRKGEIKRVTVDDVGGTDCMKCHY